MDSTSLNGTRPWPTASVQEFLERRGIDPYQGRVRGLEPSQDQIISEGPQADPVSKDTYNEHILFLCHTVALNSWNKIQKPGKRIESYTKVMQGPRETFSDFLQRLTKVVHIGIAYPEDRQVLIESLTFENANV